MVAVSLIVPSQNDWPLGQPSLIDTRPRLTASAPEPIVTVGRAGAGPLPIPGTGPVPLGAGGPEFGGSGEVVLGPKHG